MVISFYGEGCFKIQSGETAILIDSIGIESGLSAPRFKTDLELKTLIAADKLWGLITGPGEYDIKGIKITGFGVNKESTKDFIKTIYLMEAEGVKLCFLGHLAEALEAEIAEKLEEIDVLFIPAGGKPFLDQKTAASVIKEIEPKIVIPSFYKISGLKRKADDLKIFLEAIGRGKEKIEPQEKLTIKKKDLVEIKKIEIVVLSS